MCFAALLSLGNGIGIAVLGSPRMCSNPEENRPELLAEKVGQHCAMYMLAANYVVPRKIHVGRIGTCQVEGCFRCCAWIACPVFLELRGTASPGGKFIAGMMREKPLFQAIGKCMCVLG